MKILVFLALMGLHSAGAVTHSLQYFYTASSGIEGFPEFINLGMLDGAQIDYYDSNIKKVIPKQDWMAKTEGPEYWERETQVSIGTEASFKSSIAIISKRFNQTQGVHILQNMDGCEWDDETGDFNGFDQYGYDGEDFIAYDLKRETWVAPKQQAVITKDRWNNDKAYMAQNKNYYTEICIVWLKKYLEYGRSSLMRTDLPSVSLLQKTPSSPVSCHATGFYTQGAVIFWRKDGEELHEDVELGEILPNNDGSFQKSVDLDISSVPSEDWRRYECVLQLSGVRDDIITKLDKAVIRTNEKADNTITIVIAVVVVALILTGAIAGFMVYKKKDAKHPLTSPSDNDSDVSEKLNTQA